MKGKEYLFQTATKNIIIGFGASSAANFDKYVGDFDSSVKGSLKIAGTTDVTVVPEFPLAAILGITAVIGVVAILSRTKMFPSWNKI
jgi:hypothetical protein